jgi:hypothetical protein
VVLLLAEEVEVEVEALNKQLLVLVLVLECTHGKFRDRR